MCGYRKKLVVGTTSARAGTGTYIGQTNNTQAQAVAAVASGEKTEIIGRDSQIGPPPASQVLIIIYI